MVKLLQSRHVEASMPFAGPGAFKGATVCEVLCGARNGGWAREICSGLASQ